MLSLETPRPPEDWPTVLPLPVSPFDPQAVPRDVPLRTLSKAVLLPAVLELGKGVGLRIPELGKTADVLRGDGMDIVCEIFGDLFPHLHDQ